MWICAGVGGLAAIAAIFIGFVPPSQLGSGNILAYELFLFGGIAILGGAPLLIYQLRKPGWMPKGTKGANL